jgi:L-cysteine:1D-myo-inositol 2-amino-2-deoxy-alpha-D-glucopyranoside ligase
MSKSRGNLVFVSKLRAAGVDPMAIRLVLLAHHYRDDWEYTDADLTAAVERLRVWRAAAARSTTPDAEALLEAVRMRLEDDLDGPGALAIVDAWAADDRGGDGASTGGGDLMRATVDALLGIAL